MKILILGASGMLGSDCQSVLSVENEVITPGREELDIVSWDRVIETLQDIEPDVVLNCAAFTDVDACEKEELRVWKVNVEGPRNLAQSCARFGCKFIHISSDYVFDGLKPMPQPYFEDDPVNPLSAYGKSKLESEVAVRENSPNYVILRTGWLYGAKGQNFVKSIVTRACQKKPVLAATDQFGSPTWTDRLARQIKPLIAGEGRGTYHATAEGYCSRYDYALHVLKKLDLDVAVEACNLNDFGGIAHRPRNCLLENRLLHNQGINLMIDWKEDLDKFLDQFGEKILAEARQHAEKGAG
jgi:dTDP-4-dehydrorhamnose reductase